MLNCFSFSFFVVMHGLLSIWYHDQILRSWRVCEKYLSSMKEIKFCRHIQRCVLYLAAAIWALVQVHPRVVALRLVRTPTSRWNTYVIINLFNFELPKLSYICCLPHIWLDPFWKVGSPIQVSPSRRKEIGVSMKPVLNSSQNSLSIVSAIFLEI